MAYVMHLLSYDVNGESQHLIMLIVTVRTLPNRSIQSRAIIIGNAGDDLERLFPVKASWRILRHTVVIID